VIAHVAANAWRRDPRAAAAPPRELGARNTVMRYSLRYCLSLR